MKPAPLQDFGSLAPAGPIGEGAVNDDDVLDLRGVGRNGDDTGG